MGTEVVGHLSVGELLSYFLLPVFVFGFLALLDAAGTGRFRRAAVVVVVLTGGVVLAAALRAA